MRNESEHPSPRAVFAQRVKEARKRRGWKQQQLADRLAEIGYPGLSRATISKIEDPGSTRSNVSIEDVLAIAAALDCAPVHLIAPIEDNEIVRVTSGLPPAKAEVVREWIRGAGGSLRFALGVAEWNPDDLAAFLSQQPESWIKRTAEVAGLDPDQIEDFLYALREAAERNPENLPWPTGRPSVRREQLVRHIDQRKADVLAMEEELKKLDEQEREE